MPTDIYTHAVSLRDKIREAASTEPEFTYKTRRAIMGHKTGAMDDRYTIIDDEALEDAVAKMNDYQQRNSMVSLIGDLESQLSSLSEEDWSRIVAKRQPRKTAAAS